MMGGERGQSPIRKLGFSENNRNGDAVNVYATGCGRWSEVPAL
jgi:hypothetical protein